MSTRKRSHAQAPWTLSPQYRLSLCTCASGCPVNSQHVYCQPGHPNSTTEWPLSYPEFRRRPQRLLTDHGAPGPRTAPGHLCPLASAHDLALPRVVRAPPTRRKRQSCIWRGALPILKDPLILGMEIEDLQSPSGDMKSGVNRRSARPPATYRPAHNYASTSHSIRQNRSSKTPSGPARRHRGRPASWCVTAAHGSLRAVGLPQPRLRHAIGDRRLRSPLPPRTQATSQRTRATTAMRTAAQVIGHAASGSSPAPCGRAVYACRSSLMTRV